tara:strand:- start:13309 stop:15201 length:1893 start_codon:yes stop_codon:yes gene_type:complete
MCGIVGGLNLKWLSDPLVSIAQRGPDSNGKYEKGNVFLGHSRLSILDTSEAGNQPMLSDDKNFILVFNGEIYNHHDVREELTKEYGISFKSNSDTETLLKGWMLEGELILKRLNGIFSFAIIDCVSNNLHVVRDPFGVKPLYIYQKGNEFAFSSEMKSFTLLENFDSLLSLEGIGNYLSFLWSPGSQTMYKKVKKLLPGHLLQIDLEKGGVLVRKYSNPLKSEKVVLTESEWIDKLDIALNRAVERQMLSDVPLGFFLSGGLDSSLLVAIAKRQNPNLGLDCFTVDTSVSDGKEGFTDDLPYARKVAEYLDVNLHEVRPVNGSIDRFNEMVYALDEPQADLAPENVRLIANLAKKMGVKVLIGGAAGDDLFSGYRRHLAIGLENKLNAIPTFILSTFQKLFNLLPSKVPTFRRMKKFSRDWDKKWDERLLGYFNWLPDNDFVFELVNGLKKDYDVYNYAKTVLKEYSNSSALNQMLEIEKSTFLIDHNLNYTDKLSMKEGVEARVPFLDLELVNLASGIPDDLRLKNGEAKYILKKVAERYLPKEVIYRSKTGFGSPVRDMIENEFRPLINLYLNEKRIMDQGIFNSEKINNLIQLHYSGKEDFGYTILSLLAIQSWLEQFPWTIENSKK